MKPASLSMRLGLSVVFMGAALVVLLTILAYFALTHELSSLATESLRGKLSQMEHRLAEDKLTTRDLKDQPHELLDLVLGHDNLRLTIYESGAQVRELLSINDLPAASPASDTPLGTISYDKSTDSRDHNILIATTAMRLVDGEKIIVRLAMDRTSDEDLLSAYFKSTLAALPFVLLFIGAGAWWVVQRGLKPLKRFGKIASLVSTQDLTHRIPVERLPKELGELAEGINFMLHRLDGGVQQLSQFSDDLAHELRSPISNLMGKAQVSLSRQRTQEEYKAVLESSIEELERVTRIVSDMLFIAHVSHPAALVKFEAISLGDEVSRVVDLFQMAAEEKHITLSIEGAGEVRGDRLMIQRAISNLLSNAIRHTPTGNSIDLSIEEREGSTILSIRNPGSGIAQQHLPHIFERFYRVDASRCRADGGTGLGLSIVRSIMSLHHGSVSVDSTVGGTTLFRLTFAH